MLDYGIIPIVETEVAASLQGFPLDKVSALLGITPKFVWVDEGRWALTHFNKSGGFCVMRRCTKCKEEKPTEQFVQRKETKDGLSSWCKDCMAEYNKGRRESEEYKAKERGYSKQSFERLQSDPERKQRKANRDRVWSLKKYYRVKENDPERWQENLRRSNEVRTVKRNTDPAYKAWEKAQHHKRRALEQSGQFTSQEWLDLCERYDNRCLCCGEQKPLTVDHIKPLSKGGTNTIDNIQPLCLSCNTSKGTKEIDYRW